MEYFPAPLEKLVEQFARLPGIGGKSAQRLAFFVLGLPEEEAKEFADAILDAKQSVTCCPVCQNFTAGVLFSRELLALNYSETYYSTKGEEITKHPQITVSYRTFLYLFFENIISLHNFETILALQVVAESVTSESESCGKC